MSTVILVFSNGKSQLIDIQKVVTTVGNSPDHDVVIKDLPEPGFSILKEDQGLMLMPLDPKAKKLKGSWNSKLKRPEILNMGETSLLALPGINLKDQDGTLKDWDFKKLPQNPRTLNYPEKLLGFLLESMCSNEGALFHFNDGHLKELASRHLKIRDKAAFFLKEVLEDQDKTVLKVHYGTHSTLFEEGSFPCDFILVRSPLPDLGEVILYLPENGNHCIPEGILKTLLHFASHGLSLHLIHQYNERFRSQIAQGPKQSGPFFGQDSKMQHLKSLADKLAKTDLSLLILGETGSGKEMLARYMAEQSHSKKMVAINCAAIPKELAESTLFGHMKGSFTGAIKDQIGKVTEADGGTLFLDEIGELSLDIQAKLLRVLQEKTVTPVGGREHKVNVRVIAATHQDLIKLIQEGKFREDLYYRLNEASLVIPPLRDRGEDIELLAQLFLEEFVSVNGMANKSFSPDCKSFLQSYAFPGNVRELRSIVRRAAVLVDGEFIKRPDLERLTGPVQKNTFSMGELPLNMADAKKIFVSHQIQRALKKAKGNKTQAAEYLGLTARSLFRLIAELDQDGILAAKEDGLVELH